MDGPSLSANHKLRIDTTPPRVMFITTLRDPDTYGAGESVDFQVVFDKPVVTNGYPRIALNFKYDPNNSTATNRTTSGSDANRTRGGAGARSRLTRRAYAVYDPLCSSMGATLGDSVYDEGFVYASTNMSICFRYDVSHGDKTASHLSFAHPDALELGPLELNGYTDANGSELGSILRQSSVPTTPANLALPKQPGIEPWQLVQQYQVVVHGLHHETAADLDMTITHDTKHVALVNASGAFGERHEFSSDSISTGFVREDLQVRWMRPLRVIRGIGLFGCASLVSALNIITTLRSLSDEHGQ